VDSSGNAYVTGSTHSTNFPTANPLQASKGDRGDAFVTKLNATGSAVVYSTYLGGNGSDIGLGIAVDSSGNAYVTGLTDSTNFPTANPLQASNGGGLDAFVATLNAAGSALVYSTYLGGSGTDGGRGVAVDSLGNAYVTGSTRSTNFPTANPLQASNGGDFDAFMTKIISASPAELITVLTNTINSFNLQPGIANSLEAKLNAAQASLAKGNTTAACNQINAFINEVQARTGPNKELTSAQANQLIAAANQIKATLGCP
jgi:hypothetical protein